MNWTSTLNLDYLISDFSNLQSFNLLITFSSFSASGCNCKID